MGARAADYLIMHRILLSFAAVLLLLISRSLAGEGEPTLRAGAAMSNITPELGSAIIGGFVPFPATHVHDELHARCLVLDDGKTMVALVVCDLLGMHRSVSMEARKLIQDATGIPPERVLISCTHTHSAASALGSERFTSEQPLNDYQRFVAKRIADGVRCAINRLRPAEIGFGTVEAPEHVFNRRWFMREGTVPLNPFGKMDRVKMNPPAGSKDLVEPAGPTDPTVSFIALREPGGRMISVFSAYSLHYVGGVGDGHISSDYYGMFCEALKARVGGGVAEPAFVALMANGTSGDVNNIAFRVPRGPKAAYEQMRHVAEDLAEKVHGALAGIRWERHAALETRYRELSLSWRTVEPELLQWANEKLAAGSPAKADLPSIYAGRVQHLARASGPALAPIQVLRIGDVCVGTSPCETFAEMGLEFKKRNPFAKAFMLELNHAYLGYLPTPRHFALGGYETWPGTNALEPEASVKILSALLEMAGELSPKGQ